MTTTAEHFNDRPSKLSLIHVRMPPGCAPSAPPQRPFMVHAAYYRQGNTCSTTIDFIKNVFALGRIRFLKLHNKHVCSIVKLKPLLELKMSKILDELLDGRRLRSIQPLVKIAGKKIYNI